MGHGASAQLSGDGRRERGLVVQVVTRDAVVGDVTVAGDEVEDASDGRTRLRVCVEGDKSDDKSR